jgi:hypothetical protein
MSSAVKLSDDLVETARREARIRSRSMTQQIEHWARIGRIVERMGSIEPQRLRAALAAELPFDSLTPEERAVVLGHLELRVFRPEGDAALEKELAEAPGPRAELDDRGRLVTVEGGVRRLVKDVSAGARKLKRRR